MIKFFRKIRQKLLSENKFSKYLIYAFGEIILVVIGILIALQINNLNELHKSEKKEVKILSEIKNNLVEDLIDHDQNIFYITYKDSIFNLLLTLLNSDSPYDNSLSKRMMGITLAGPHFNPIKTGYNTMTSNDPEIISNDSLRINIAILYETKYLWLESVLQDIYNNQNAWFAQIFLKRFKVIPNTSTHFEPINFEELKKDHEFISTLAYYRDYWNNGILRRYKNYRTDVQLLINFIENEIAQIQD